MDSFPALSLSTYTRCGIRCTTTSRDLLALARYLLIDGMLTPNERMKCGASGAKNDMLSLLHAGVYYQPAISLIMCVLARAPHSPSVSIISGISPFSFPSSPPHFPSPTSIFTIAHRSEMIHSFLSQKDHNLRGSANATKKNRLTGRNWLTCSFLWHLLIYM